MKNALIFLGGAAVGGLAATLYFKRKMVILEEDYQRIANDEINKYIEDFDLSVKKADKIEIGHSHGDKDIKIISDVPIVKYSSGIDMGNDEEEYVEIVKKYNGQEENASDEDEEDEQIAPYIITPDEYGDDDEYATRTLTAFTDKAILDEDNCLFDTNYFGKDIMKTIYSKKNADSSIFVRDDNEKVDYEIIKEKISFEDFTKLTDSEDK